MLGPQIGIHSVVSVGKSFRKELQSDEKIGRITENDRVKTNSQDEAVISYSIKPLASLVTDPELKECVQKAVLGYIIARLRKISESFKNTLVARNFKTTIYICGYIYFLPIAKI